MSLNQGYVVPKTRSFGQIVVKPCVLFIHHIFLKFFMKLCQNVCLYDYFGENVGHIVKSSRILV